MTDRPMRKLKRMRSMRVLLMPIYFERLVWAARERGMTVDVLVHALIETIARDDLVKAVLDDGYNATDDFAKSIDLAYETIRARKAAGGSGWEPP
jgi:hypothetical protein